MNIVTESGFVLLEQPVIIGPYTITRFSHDKLWIENVDGEGGAFSESEIEEVVDGCLFNTPRIYRQLDKYFNENY